MEYHGIENKGRFVHQVVTTAERASLTHIEGRIVYDSDDGHIYKSDGAQWLNQDDADNLIDGSTNVIMTLTERQKLATLNNPMLFKGEITINTDFPLIADVQNGWVYAIKADVTDNAGVTYTNTGDSFSEDDEIAWDGSGWVVLGMQVSDQMRKSQYDTDLDGIVDKAEQLEGPTGGSNISTAAQVRDHLDDNVTDRRHLTDDQNDAVDGANSPSSGNVFATMDDVSGYTIRNFFRFVEQQPANTSGTTLTDGAYTTLIINTEKLNESDIVLSSNQLTLQAGSTYIINVRGDGGFATTYFRVKIQSISGDSIEEFGTSERGDQASFYDHMTPSSFIHNFKVTPTQNTVIEIQMYCAGTGGHVATAGVPVNYNSEDEIYTEVWGEQIG